MEWPSRMQFEALANRVEGAEDETTAVKNRVATLENTIPSGSPGIVEAAPWEWIDLFQRTGNPVNDGYALDSGGGGAMTVQATPVPGVTGALILTIPAGGGGYASVQLPTLLNSSFGELQVRMALIGGDSPDASAEIGLQSNGRLIDLSTRYGLGNTGWATPVPYDTWETWRLSFDPVYITARRGNGEEITRSTPADWVSNTPNPYWRINLSGTTPADAELKLLVDYMAWRPAASQPLVL